MQSEENVVHFHIAPLCFKCILRLETDFQVIGRRLEEMGDQGAQNSEMRRDLLDSFFCVSGLTVPSAPSQFRTH